MGAKKYAHVSKRQLIYSRGKMTENGLVPRASTTGFNDYIKVTKGGKTRWVLKSRHFAGKRLFESNPEIQRAFARGHKKSKIQYASNATKKKWDKISRGEI